MKILHLCLACFYIDSYNYQENVLPRIHKEDGHDVRILASTETFIDNQKLGYIEPSEYVTEYGVPIKRLPYVKVGNHFTTIKFRKYPNLYEEIAAFEPDVIMSHDIGYWSILDVVRYKKEHPEVKFYADTHTDACNSGTNWLSLHVLHRGLYRCLIRKAAPYLDRYFYLSQETRKFNQQNYSIPESLFEFYPLGGTVFSDGDYIDKRLRRRKELSVADDELLLVHSGKLTAEKRTADLLRAFAAVPELKAKLAVIGVIPDNMKPSLKPLVETDSRVQFLGWKNAAELQEYLCAADLYCQPGSQSATMQNAVCCRCPVLLYPHSSYKANFDCGNIFWADTEESIGKAFREIATGEVNLKSMSENSLRCARELLDYRVLAGRLYR